MSEDSGARPDVPRTAGGLLRQARQAQGLHIAALATSIKVTPRKLELLESDQIDQLPDATFARALAQTVCRALKIDPAPVLALLPPSAGYRIEQVAEGLNEPFRERPGRLVPSDWAHVGSSPALWGAALLLLAAAVVYLLPQGWFNFGSSATAPEPAASAVVSMDVPAPLETPLAMPPMPAASAPAEAPPPPVPEVVSAMPAPALAATLASAGPPTLQVSTTAPSWVEVVDAKGRPLVSRVVPPGEPMALNGELPMKVKIGNALVTQVAFRGQPLELAPHTRDNVARFELKP